MNEEFEKDKDEWIGNSLIVLLIIFTGVLCYEAGKQHTLNLVENIVKQEEKIEPNSVIIEDLKIDISKLRRG